MYVIVILKTRYYCDELVTSENYVYDVGVFLMELQTGQVSLSRDAIDGTSQYIEHLDVC